VSIASARRSTWILLILDQLCSSVSNQLVIFAVAKISGAREIGIIAIVVGIVSLQNAAMQGAVIDSSAGMAGVRGYGDYVFVYAASLPTSVIAASLLGLHGVILFIVYVLVLPAQALQSTLRGIFILSGRVARAVLIDSAAALVIVTGYVLVLAGHITSARSAIDIWILSGAVAALLGLAIVVRNGSSTVTQTMPKLRDSGRLKKAVGYGIDGLTGQLAAQAMLWEIAIFINTSSAGVLRLAQQALFPVVLLVAGSRTAILGSMFRITELKAARLATTCIALISAISAAGACVAYLLPRHVVSRLLGPTWTASRHVVLLFGVEGAASATIVLSGLLLRRISRVSDILRMRAAGITTQLVAVGTSCLIFRTQWAAAVGVAGGSVAVAVLWLLWSQRLARTVTARSLPATDDDSAELSTSYFGELT
jgi:hypothetical protein